MTKKLANILVASILIGMVVLVATAMMLINQRYQPENISSFSVAPTPIPTEYPVQKATFLAVGDVMLSRGVDQAIRKKNNPLRPFEGMKEVFESVDFTFANFEAPINGTDFAGKDGSLVFNVPMKNLEGLKKYRFEVLNLANNHALDQGEDGLISTESILQEQGLLTVGTGRTLAEAWDPVMIEKNGITIAFITASYASYNDNGKRRNDWVARMEDVHSLQSSIQNAKKNADVVIVSMHAGGEYVRNPNDVQKAFAHAAIDYGADMVIGAHPHWVQITEQYNGKMIFYSLGNFIFDQEWSQETKRGLALKIAITKQGLNTTVEVAEYIPVVIENYSTPRRATGTEAKEILKSIGREE